eukprot:c17743_g2_i1.p1 GENE.c17743_g2_i1~~c17743_g2_i1.p1  ORF type:complete len:206 (-),score=22.83 c17743_g2_i1:232-849(-)
MLPQIESFVVEDDSIQARVQTHQPICLSFVAEVSDLVSDHDDALPEPLHNFTVQGEAALGRFLREVAGTTRILNIRDVQSALSSPDKSQTEPPHVALMRIAWSYGLTASFMSESDFLVMLRSDLPVQPQPPPLAPLIPAQVIAVKQSPKPPPPSPPQAQATRKRTVSPAPVFTMDDRTLNDIPEPLREPVRHLMDMGFAKLECST